MDVRKNKSYFITATDTHVGKTITTFVLGALLQDKGINVGVLKPVQCAGSDAHFLKTKLRLQDELSLINPIFVKEPLSPHLALRRVKKTFDEKKVLHAYQELKKRHDFMLIEGAGGLMVPLREGYYNTNLVKALNAEVIIVARLGLGTINHTLLTINAAKAYGLTIKGLIFSDVRAGKKDIAEQTNPYEIERLSGVKVLGVIPFLKSKTRKEALRLCQHITID